ncbi:fimbrial protein [Salmonella enterica]|nr:fimbrial protein [Salmonella enterica]ELH4156638.1 fimbrial protein [Salmonella enterica]
MKKIFIASAILMGVTSTAASANGDVTFFGSVTATTCSLVPEVDGAVNKMIQLGQAKPSNDGKLVHFSLKKDPSDTSCDTTLGATNIKAQITWSAPEMGPTGLGIVSGAAKDSRVEIKTVNAEGANQVTITSTTDNAEFTGADVLAEGAKYTAQLKGGTTPGDFRSAAAYSVVYK